MKKLYTLLLVASTTLGFAQVPIITGILDGDCNGGNPKAVEIYANGTVNFALYSMQNQTNGTTGAFGTTLSLAALGTKTNTFVYVILGGIPSATAGDPTPIANVDRFALEFANIPAGNILNPPTGTPSADFPQPVNINGDDRIRVINTATTVVIDQFGVSDVDGSGTPWEYVDSWAKRNNGTGPDGANFNTANWTFGGVAALDGLGACQAGPAFSTLVPFGQYTLGVSQNSISGLSVYPNPVTNGNLYITSDNNASKAVVIYDVLGKAVVKATVNDQAINVSALKGGVYIVKITEEGKTATRKLVIR